jgi:hypothetical protein
MDRLRDLRASAGIIGALVMVVLGVYGASQAAACPMEPIHDGGLQPTAYTNPVSQVVLGDGSRLDCTATVCWEAEP